MSRTRKSNELIILKYQKSMIARVMRYHQQKEIKKKQTVQRQDLQANVFKVFFPFFSNGISLSDIE